MDTIELNLDDSNKVTVYLHGNKINIEFIFYKIKSSLFNLIKKVLPLLHGLVIAKKFCF